MESKAALSVEEYLHTSFPGLDKEYRDGELVERTLPDYPHGRTQLLLGAYFLELSKARSLFPCSETRMRLRPGIYLIPDIAVFHPVKPPRIPETPPLIAIEILSPDDRWNAVRDKLQEYRDWGVPHVWLVDPNAKRMYTCNGELHEVATLTIPELGIELKPANIFE
jgi:Uma2 family endonuclease